MVLSLLPSFLFEKEGRRDRKTGGGTAKGTAVLLRSSTQNNRRFFAMVKPDKQDFDAIEKKYGPLPANASERQHAERYREAQAHQIIRENRGTIVRTLVKDAEEPEAAITTVALAVIERAEGNIGLARARWDHAFEEAERINHNQEPKD
jgi:hypothetical protein